MTKHFNEMTLTGRVESIPCLHHRTHGEDFFQMYLCVPRLSGMADVLPIVFPERSAPPVSMDIGSMVRVSGQVRSHNLEDVGRTRLVVFVYARRIEALETPEESVNDVRAAGTLCKAPTHRFTPAGREITDMMIRIDRTCSRRDYIPCIAWEANARIAAGLRYGDTVEFSGRFQSRVYQKTLEDGTVENKIAYEVSVFNLLLL